MNSIKKGKSSAVPLFKSQTPVRSVAVGRVFCVFTLAEINFFFNINLKLCREYARTLMRTIAKGLVFTFSTGTPKVNSWF
jgi:hypothetical protein